MRYDVPQLMKDKAVSNAFEVVKQIPGVISTDDAVQLLGAGSPSIVINGQLTTMSVDQLVGLLKTIPASRVCNVEIMYNAPAKYNIKGAMINVVLDKETVERILCKEKPVSIICSAIMRRGKSMATCFTPHLVSI